jgi:hypothetical protein
MGSHSSKLFEILILVFSSVIIISVLVNPVQYGLNNVPVAVSGLTTISGILVGFAGFSLTHAYSSHDNYQFRRWFKKRVTVLVLPIVLGFMFIAFAYFSLVQNNLELSFRFAAAGLFTILSILIESYLIMISDEADYLTDVN